LDAALGTKSDYLVLSGSLPRCAPDDFYASVADKLRDRATQLILDTSGEPLRQALEAGGLFLVKPSRNELAKLARRELPSHQHIAEAALEWVHSGSARHVAVTLGSEGAILVKANLASFMPAIAVDTRSAVGAGDSFLAGMIAGVIEGMDVTDAFKLGMAAGAATAQTPGTDLCHPDDVRALLPHADALQPIQV
jgi:6-phosphofructokinase 2